MRDYQAVSADSHLENPPWQWAERLPKEYRERGPRRIEMPDGGEGWVMEGQKPEQLKAMAITGGLPYHQIQGGSAKIGYSDLPPGTGGPEQRVREQEQDRIDAELLFCSVSGSIARNAEPNLAQACVQAYNDWLSEYCSYAPDRLWGLALIPTCGINEAVAELKRVAHKPGIRGVQLLSFPSGRTDISQEDEPFWAAAADEQVTLVGHHNWVTELHTRPPVEIPGAKQGSGQFAWLLNTDMETPTLPVNTILQLFLSGVFDRHPELRMLFAETHAGWLPFWFEQIDDRYQRHRWWAGVNLKMLPSEYIKSYFKFVFLEDHVAVKLREEIGVDTLCWSNDFPHSVSDWPYSWEVIEREFAGVPDEERRKILALNAAEWMRVITPADKERMAKEPAAHRWEGEVLPRNVRRLAGAPSELVGAR